MSKRRARDRIVFSTVQSVYGLPVPTKLLKNKDLADIFQAVLSERTTHMERIRELENRATAHEESLRINPLTGLPNGLALYEELSSILSVRRDAYEDQREQYQKTLKLAKQQGKDKPPPFSYAPLDPLTVGYCDCTNFGELNNRFGQEATNGLIQAVAKLLSKDVRQGNNERLKDFIARSNEAGDEFVIVFPKTDGATAKARLGKILNGNGEKRGIRNYRFLVETPDNKHFLLRNVTFSFGCYQLDPQLEQNMYDKDYVTVMHKAQKLMKVEKDKVKNTPEILAQITEITDPNQLSALQYDTDVIKVYPVTPMKKIGRTR